ncbi:MAG: FAD/NAD(P)-binding protein [Acidimicrobiia bacterium]
MSNAGQLEDFIDPLDFAGLKEGGFTGQRQFERSRHYLMQPFFNGFLQRYNIPDSAVFKLTEQFKSAFARQYIDRKNLSPIFATAMLEPELRKLLLDSIDETVEQESARIKQEALEAKSLEYDFVIVGSGPHGVAAASKILEKLPHAKVLIVERDPQIGGQFRKNGAAFRLNSRSHRPSSQFDTGGLPGGDLNLNPLGPVALQLSDVVGSTYPTGIDIGDVTAINGFLACDIVTEAEFVGFDRKFLEEKYEIRLRDTQTGETYKVNSYCLFAAPGIGEQPKDAIASNSTSAFDLFQDVKRDPAAVLDRYSGKRVLVIGAGDTGRVTGEFLARLGPDYLYAASPVQLCPLPEKIIWSGQSADSSNDFQGMNRSRYAQISAFLPREQRNYVSIIDPVDVRVASVVNGYGGEKIVSFENGTQVFVDEIIDARSLLPEQIIGMFVDDTQLATTDVPAIGNAQVGRISSNGAIALIGPASNPGLTQYERNRGANIGENTVALWATIPRTVEAVTEAIERRASSLRFSTTFSVFSGIDLQLETYMPRTPDDLDKLVQRLTSNSLKKSNSSDTPFIDEIRRINLNNINKIDKTIIKTNLNSLPAR